MTVASKLLHIDISLPRVFKHSVCSACKKVCCEHLPGAASPVQFGAPDREKIKRNLIAAFSSGRWQVDWWEGDERGQGYFVRAGITGEERIKSPSWGGRCTFLGLHGCELTAENRPAECCALIPDFKNGCHGPATGKKFYVDLWQPYWDVIDEAIEVVERECTLPEL